MSEIAQSLKRTSLLEFYLETRSEHYLMGETTFEIGLAYMNKNIICVGKNLIVYKGKDDEIGEGELMIATKNLNGCWNHYPHQDNEAVPLSDYKKAKLALEKFPVSLKGELVHRQSEKLAKLLGLTVKDGYAYLVK
ncbi:hypothetical protein [Microcoleus sp. K4-B3]|uniref:hypothetical protein n=1 Tax=Microcoleus sp. K4-B3 TaxID=2818791 RepID=UPI002FD3EF6F